MMSIFFVFYGFVFDLASLGGNMPLTPDRLKRKSEERGSFRGIHKKEESQSRSVSIEIPFFAFYIQASPFSRVTS